MMTARAAAAILALFVGQGCLFHGVTEKTPVMWDVSLPQREKEDFAELLTHLLPEGLIVSQKMAPGGLRELYVKGAYQADGAYLQGHLIAMLVYKWKVTGDPEVLTLANRAFDAGCFLVEGSGYPGLVARSFGKKDHTKPGFDFNTDASGDQMIGLLYGFGVWTRHVRDAGRRARLAAMLEVMCVHMDAHDYHVHRGPRSPNRYGSMKTPVAGVPIGFYAMPMLALGNISLRLNPHDDPVLAFRDRLFREDFPEQSAAFYSWFPHAVFNVSNYALSFATAMSYEESPERRALYMEGIEAFWDRVYDWQMALFALLYKQAGGKRRPEMIRDSMDRLRNLPRRRHRLLDEARHVKRHSKAVPIEKRPMTPTYWDSPVNQELTTQDGPRDDTAYTRIDFLLAYWLGRYMGEYGE